MQTVSASPKRETQSCPSPVAVWQSLLAHLLAQHYGLTLNDTAFSDDTVIRKHIDAGISLADALNFIVEKFDLVRIAPSGFLLPRTIPFRHHHRYSSRPTGLWPDDPTWLPHHYADPPGEKRP